MPETITEQRRGVLYVLELKMPDHASLGPYIKLLYNDRKLGGINMLRLSVLCLPGHEWQANRDFIADVQDLCPDAIIETKELS